MFIVFLIIVFGVACYALYCRIQDLKLLKTATQPYRGTRSERRLVMTLLKLGIPAETIYHDLYLKKTNGTYSQIDLVVPTKVGLIVFEVKEYSGWIFGKCNNEDWMQVLSYGRLRNRFYNPVMQNSGHILSLRKSCEQLKYLPVYSVIVFYGNSTFRDISGIPQNTYIIKPQFISETIDEILLNKTAMYASKREVITILKRAVNNGESIDIQMKHVENVRNILDKRDMYY